MEVGELPMLPEQLINQFIFYPEPQITVNPHVLDMPFDDVWLSTSDDVDIHGWWLPCEDALASILFLHGNAGNITHRLDNLRLLNEAGFQVLIIDYRGFGRSEGTPGEQGTYRDAEAAWHWLVKARPGPHLVFGRSLGGAVGIQLAATSSHRPDGVIIENTFTSGRELAAEVMPIRGMGFVVPNFYPSIERIGKIDAPLLLIHSLDDELIPVAHGELLFDAAVEPKESYFVPGAHHNDAYATGGQAYVDRLQGFVRGLRGSKT
jgi:fermentation-respiration switch protein FrsA (DUF1100 family)